MGEECSYPFVEFLGFCSKKTRDTTDIEGEVPPILKTSSCILGFLPTLLSCYNLLGSGPAIRGLVCIYDANVDDVFRALIVESSHKKVASVEEVATLVGGSRGWRSVRRAVD